jgi:hypothetical protein
MHGEYTERAGLSVYSPCMGDSPLRHLGGRWLALSPEGRKTAGREREEDDERRERLQASTKKSAILAELNQRGHRLTPRNPKYAGSL